MVPEEEYSKHETLRRGMSKTTMGWSMKTRVQKMEGERPDFLSLSQIKRTILKRNGFLFDESSGFNPQSMAPMIRAYWKTELQSGRVQDRGYSPHGR